MTVFPRFVVDSTRVHRARVMFADDRRGQRGVVEGKELIDVIADPDLEQAAGAKPALPHKPQLSIADVLP